MTTRDFSSYKARITRSCQREVQFCN